MTYSKISYSKIKPYENYKKEYSNTKKQKLINAIQIADKIYNREMTFEQHYYLCKKGIESCQKQTLYILEKNKEEKEKNKEIILLGNKRHNSNLNISFNNNFINGKELGILIEDFIYYKKGIHFEEYKLIFEKIKLMMDNNNINNNLLNALKRLLRFLNNSRNFNEQIISMDFFIEFQNIIKNKILSSLFESNNLILDEENIDEINIKELINQINNYNLEIQQKNLSISLLKQNKNKSETNEESIEVSSSGSKYEENKDKIIITPLNQNIIFQLFNSLEENNHLNLNIKENISRDYIINQIKNFSNVKSNNNHVKDCYLRRKVCLKLYNLFNVLLKNISISKKDIQNLCKGIECKARNYDNDMSTEYKNYIIQIFKIISQYFI